MEWALPTVVVFCVLSFAMAFTAIIFAINTKIDMEAFKRSTHQVQFVPMDPKALGDTDEQISKELDEQDADTYGAMGTMESLSKQSGQRPLI